MWKAYGSVAMFAVVVVADLLCHDGENLELDTVELVEACPCSRRRQS